MERVMDFLLDFALQNELCSPCGSTGNGQKPALRVNTLPTPSGFAWKTLRVFHTARWYREQRLAVFPTFSPTASQWLTTLTPELLT
jgi:hypothetical protein